MEGTRWASPPVLYTLDQYDTEMKGTQRCPTVRASKIFLWMDPYVSETNFYTTKINA